MKKLAVLLVFFPQVVWALTGAYFGEVIFGKSDSSNLFLSCMNQSGRMAVLNFYNSQDSKLARLKAGPSGVSRRLHLEGLGPFKIALDGNLICTFREPSLSFAPEPYATSFFGSGVYFFYVPEETKTFSLFITNTKDGLSYKTSFLVVSPSGQKFSETLSSGKSQFSGYKKISFEDPEPGSWKLQVLQLQRPWHYGFWLEGIPNVFFDKKAWPQVPQKARVWLKLSPGTQISPVDLYVMTKDIELARKLGFKTVSTDPEADIVLSERPVKGKTVLLEPKEDPSEAASLSGFEKVLAPNVSLFRRLWIRGFFSSLRKTIYGTAYQLDDPLTDSEEYTRSMTWLSSVEKRNLSPKRFISISRGLKDREGFYGTRETAVWLASKAVEIVSTNSVAAICWPRLKDGESLDGLLEKNGAEKPVFRVFRELSKFLASKRLYTVPSDVSKVRVLYSDSDRAYLVANSTSRSLNLSAECSLHGRALVGQASKNILQPMSVAVFKCL